jgi:hypothetical protein
LNHPGFVDEAGVGPFFVLQLALAELHRTGRLDLEAMETATRAAMRRAGASALGHLPNEGQPVPAAVACECGQTARYQQRRPANCGLRWAR